MRTHRDEPVSFGAPRLTVHHKLNALDLKRIAHSFSNTGLFWGMHLEAPQCLHLVKNSVKRTQGKIEEKTLWFECAHCHYSARHRLANFQTHFRG